MANLFCPNGHERINNLIEYWVKSNITVNSTSIKLTHKKFQETWTKKGLKKYFNFIFWCSSWIKKIKK